MQNISIVGDDLSTNPAVLYRSPGVEISTSRILVHSTPSHRTAYTIQQVASVGIRKEDANLALPALLVLGGLAMAAGGLATVNRTNAIALLVIGVVLIAAGAWLWYVAKPTFTVVIGMSSGEKATLAAEDQTAAEALETATLQAIAAKRG